MLFPQRSLGVHKILINVKMTVNTATPCPFSTKACSLHVQAWVRPKIELTRHSQQKHIVRDRGSEEVTHTHNTKYHRLETVS